MIPEDGSRPSEEGPAPDETPGPCWTPEEEEEIRAGLEAGWEDARAGRTLSLDELRQFLQDGHDGAAPKHVVERR